MPWAVALAQQLTLLVWGLSELLLQPAHLAVAARLALPLVWLLPAARRP